jgi:hypothetical protein
MLVGKNIRILPENRKKRQKTAKNSKNHKKLFLFETHPYFPPFSPRMILYTSLVQKISFYGGTTLI